MINDELNQLKYLIGMNRHFIISLFFLLSSAMLSAQVKLLPIFSDNMVLQQKVKAPIWGEATPNKMVEVTTSWNKKKYTARADEKGKWSVKVETPSAGGPYTVTISDGTPVTLKNVLIGEVWICSGQSNMEMQVEGWGKITNYKQEMAEAQKYPNIRLLQVKKEISTVPVTDMGATNGGWQVCSSETIGDFSAVGYCFGRDLNKYRNVPIGLIDTTWGGTIIETWMSAEALQTMPGLKEEVEEIKHLPATKEGREEVFNQALESWKRQIIEKDRGLMDGKPIWTGVDYDTKEWKTIEVPGLMQERGLKDFNGIVWFRKEIDIPADWENKELTLHMGQIDDSDFTYFNGVQVGETDNWMAPRSYKIPKDLVKKGKAVIAVRVIDTGGTGGIYGAPENVFIQKSETEKTQLAGPWLYKIAMSMKEIPAMPRNTSSNPNTPTYLFNAMLNPLVPYAIKGAIWYQGESNAGQAYQYRELLPLMITDWRKQWGTDFPFYIVQLANFMTQQTKPEESAWAELREAQTRTLHLDHTGMAVTIDIGEAADIHPKNKQEVGRRLALAARAQTYGEKIAYSGPMYQSYKIEGNKIRISFDHIAAGLKAKGNEALKGFAVAGVDHKFYWANAVIEGNTVVVSCPEVGFPIAVRYAWGDNPVCNLYNSAGLPASPFRTDDWRNTTYEQF